MHQHQRELPAAASWERKTNNSGTIDCTELESTHDMSARARACRSALNRASHLLCTLHMRQCCLPSRRCWRHVAVAFVWVGLLYIYSRKPLAFIRRIRWMFFVPSVFTTRLYDCTQFIIFEFGQTCHHNVSHSCGVWQPNNTLPRFPPNMSAVSVRLSATG